VTPVIAAGWRIEPPVSVPVAPATRPAATAAADPPEGRSHRKLIHIRLAKHHGPGVVQSFYYGGVIRRDEVVQHPGSAAGLRALGAENILVGEGYARQGATIALCQRTIHLLGPGERALGVNRDERVQGRIPDIDALEEVLGELCAAQLLLSQRFREFRNGSSVHLFLTNSSKTLRKAAALRRQHPSIVTTRVYSMTFGTR
jgi:hypothetical protein